MSMAGRRQGCPVLRRTRSGEACSMIDGRPAHPLGVAATLIVFVVMLGSK